MTGTLIFSGGRGGIRTRGGFNPTYAFQAYDLNRSSTLPNQKSIVSAPQGDFARYAQRTHKIWQIREACQRVDAFPVAPMSQMPRRLNVSIREQLMVQHLLQTLRATGSHTSTNDRQASDPETGTPDVRLPDRFPAPLKTRGRPGSSAHR